MVTIVTKTFQRNDCITRLISSIRKYYPSIRVIIADDNPKDNISDLQAPNTDHFVMPYNSGWNAGRNLAISQVSTEYLVWVDDDFIFNEGTKLLYWLNFLEKNPLFDLVGGKVGTDDSLFSHASKLVYEDGSKGSCIARIPGTYGEVDNPEYSKECSVTDVVQNFYMARTLSIRKIGFDNFFKRFAHKEFFIDGKGKLMVASCPGQVVIDHMPVQCNPNNGEYSKFRKPNTREWTNVMKKWYFRNNLMCMREKSLMPIPEKVSEMIANSSARQKRG